MDKELNVNIKTAVVSIQILKVDGRRMTKSVFNPILLTPCFNVNCKFIGDDIFGFVKDNDGTRYLVWTMAGKLRKTRMRSSSEINEHGGGLYGSQFWNLSISEKESLKSAYSVFLESIWDLQPILNNCLTKR